jgi:glycosyltransferase involved in cell wall biosynthesis
VNQRIYHPRDVERRADTVVFYAREFSGRRAVPLGRLALDELYCRPADTRFVLFGQVEEVPVGVPYELLGVARPEVLASLYSAATVGLCLSLMNYSLIPQEMMACGLPVVDLAGGSTEAELGGDSGVEFAPPDPVAIADALELLLDDADARAVVRTPGSAMHGWPHGAWRPGRWRQDSGRRSASVSRRSGKESIQREELRCVVHPDDRRESRGQHWCGPRVNASVPPTPIGP